jgi:hypothetical protein
VKKEFENAAQLKVSTHFNACERNWVVRVQNIQLIATQKDEQIWDVVAEGPPYFCVEFSDGTSLYTRQMKQFPLQFGREVGSLKFLVGTNYLYVCRFSAHRPYWTHPIGSIGNRYKWLKPTNKLWPRNFANCSHRMISRMKSELLSACFWLMKDAYHNLFDLFKMM